MHRVPLSAQIVAVSTGSVSSVVSEGTTAPISSMALETATLDPLKAIAIVAVTNEIAKLSNAVLAMIARELRGAVATVTNAAFFDAITTATVAFWH